MTVNEKIAALQQELLANQLDAYIIPSSDPHQSEYVADHWKSRQWISGFTGSAVWVDPKHDAHDKQQPLFQKWPCPLYLPGQIILNLHRSLP